MFSQFSSGSDVARGGEDGTHMTESQDHMTESQQGGWSQLICFKTLVVGVTCLQHLATASVN